MHACAHTHTHTHACTHTHTNKQTNFFLPKAELKSTYNLQEH